MNRADARYAWVYFWSYAALLAERLWNAFWPALSMLFAFVGCAALGLFVAFGAAAHLLLLLGFTAGFSVAATGLGAPFRVPRAREVRRAIEITSNLPHRPLETLLDRPHEGTPPEAHKLWEKYQQRLARLRARAGVYAPRSTAARRDPYGLRIAAALLLLAGLAVAQQDTGYRLRQALHVDLAQLAHGTPVSLEAWIVPPDYTAQNPVFLATAAAGAAPAQGPVTVPEGSLLKLRVSGVDAPPAATYGGKPLPKFSVPAPGSFALETPLADSGELRLKQGWFRKLGAWEIAVKPDLPPEITLLGTSKDDHAGLKIAYHASDDYGVTRLFGAIEPAGKGRGISKRGASEEAFEFDMPLPDDPLKDEQTYTADLAAHPLAGTEVMLTLSAGDAAGHVTTTPPKKIVLPERDFKNPTAQKIIAQRRKLILYDNLITEKLVAGALFDIADEPVNYRGDETVFLGLDMAAKRLGYDGGPEAVQSDVALLWDLAVRVEDGGLSLAARELSDALQRFAEALKDKNTSKEQLQELLDKVHQKMREYMQTLSAEMRQRMQDGKQSPKLSQELVDKIMKRVDMDKLMQQLKDLTQGTEREQMEKMAKFLKNTVDRLDPAQMDRIQESQKKAIDALNKLQQLIERQQSLLDRTNRMTQQKPPQEQPARQQEQQQEQKQGQDQSGHDQSGKNQSGSEQSGQEQSGSGGQQGQPQSNPSSGDQPGAQAQQGQNEGQSQGQDQQAGAAGQQQQQPGGSQGQPQQQAGGQGQNGQQQQPAGGSQGKAGTAGNSGPQGPGGLPAPALPGPGPSSGQGSDQGSAPGSAQGPDMSGGRTGADTGKTGKPGAGGKPAGAAGAAGGQDQAGANFPQARTPREGATEQGAIRGQLGDMLRDLGGGMDNMPPGFAKADQAMKAAQEALKEGDPRGSAPQQKAALDALQQAENEALDQIAQSMQMSLSFGQGSGAGEGGFGEGFDPLGRGDGNGKTNEEDVKLPDEKEQRRVQQILEELRSRSNEYQRPKVERDYIDRLLDQLE